MKVSKSRTDRGNVDGGPLEVAATPPMTPRCRGGENPRRTEEVSAEECDD
jgi:hypothetical protein